MLCNKTIINMLQEPQHPLHMHTLRSVGEDTILWIRKLDIT
jgi:hypothetical protein